MTNYYTLFSFAITKLTPEEIAWARKNIGALEASDNGAPFESEIDLDSSELRIFSQDRGNVDGTVEFVQEFLKDNRPKGIVGFEWADTCSRPVTDNFGGGAAVMTANTKVVITTYEWVSETRNILYDKLNG